MSPRIIAGAMIAFGAFLMATGILMDVTVESGYGSVVNLHKVSQQQALLIVGGIVFMSGILVFGFWRRKLTAEDENKARLIAKERQDKLVEVAGKASRGIEGIFVGLRALFISKGEGFGKIILRVLTALFSVWIIQYYGPGVLYLHFGIWVDTAFSVIVFGAAVAYSLIAQPAYVVISRLLMINVVSSVLAIGMVIYNQLMFYLSDDGLIDEFLDSAIRHGIVLIVNIVFCLAFLYLIRSKCSKTEKP